MDDTHKRLGIAILTAIALTIALMVPVYATQPETTKTCKDLGFEDLTENTSGAWGSVDFDDTEEELTLTVNSGFTVMLCVKAGSAKQGLGPETSGPYAEGTHQVGHTSGKELSHYGVIWTPVTTTTADTTTTSVESTTSTSVEETTTTSTGSSTTTTDPTTTSSVESTTSSTVSPTTTEPELPFTGGPGVGFLTAIGGMLLGLGYATLRGSRMVQK